MKIEFPLNGSIEEQAETAEKLCSAYADDPGKVLHPLYDSTVDLAKALKVHFDFDARPSDENDFLNRKRPNERKAVREYRLLSYEPVTVAEMQKPVTFLSRMFNPAISSFIFPEDDEKLKGISAKDYFTRSFPIYGSLRDFLKNHYLRFLLSDPNGWTTIRTPVPDTALEPSDVPEPRPYLIPSSHVVNYGSRWFWSLSDTKSEVQLSEHSETVKEGLVFFFYLPDVTFRVVQVGIKADNRFFAETWNFHEADNKAARMNRGILSKTVGSVESEGDSVYYHSYFQPAIAYLNGFADLHSNQGISFVLRIFLQKYEEAVNCPKCNGSGIAPRMGVHQHNTREACGTCEGTGLVIAKDVTNVYRKKLGAGQKLEAPAGYIPLPTDIVKVTEEKLKTEKSNALSALFMDSLDSSRMRANSSGEAIKQSKDGLFALVETIAETVFSNMGQFVADASTWLRYRVILGEEQTVSQAPTLPVPDKYDLSSLVDGLATLEKFKEIGSSKEAIRFAYIQQAEGEFGQLSDQAKIVRAELTLDPFAVYSEDELLEARQTQMLSEEDLFKTVNRSKLLHLAILEAPGFLDFPFQDQKQIFDSIADRLFNEETGQTEPDEGITVQEGN